MTHPFPRERLVVMLDELAGIHAVGQAQGVPLGLMSGVEYDQQEVELTPEERVLFYSDGLVEVHNSQREMLGFDGLEANLVAAPHGDGVALIEFLLGRLATFTDIGWEQEDDLVLVVLERGARSPSL